MAGYHSRAKRDARRELAIPAEGSCQGATFELAHETAGIPEKVARAESIEIAESCLAEMDETWREVILLRVHARGSWDYIAQKLDRPSAHAAEELYQRARRELKRRVFRRMKDSEDSA